MFTFSPPSFISLPVCPSFYHSLSFSNLYILFTFSIFLIPWPAPVTITCDDVYSIFLWGVCHSLRVRNDGLISSLATRCSKVGRETVQKFIFFSCILFFRSSRSSHSQFYLSLSSLFQSILLSLSSHIPNSQLDLPGITASWRVVSVKYEKSVTKWVLMSWTRQGTKEKSSLVSF